MQRIGSIPDNCDQAEAMAISALAFLAERPEDLGRFLALSGIDPASLRGFAGELDFLAGVLDFLLGDEPLLVAFAGHAGVPPGRVVAARRRFDGGPQRLVHEDDPAQP